MKSREKKALEELRVNGEVSEETTDSYREIYKVSFDALEIKGGSISFFLSFLFIVFVACYATLQPFCLSIHLSIG